MAHLRGALAQGGLLGVLGGEGQQAIGQAATGPSRKYQKITAKKLW